MTKKQSKTNETCSPHTPSLVESTWLLELCCQFLEQHSGHGACPQRWADGWAGDPPQAAMAKSKETGAETACSQKGPALPVLAWALDYSLSFYFPLFLLPPPPHKHTHPSPSSKVADDLTLGLSGHRSLQFSCGRRQKNTLHSLCAPVSTKPFIHSPRTRLHIFKGNYPEPGRCRPVPGSHL